MLYCRISSFSMRRRNERHDAAAGVRDIDDRKSVDIERATGCGKFSRIVVADDAESAGDGWNQRHDGDSGGHGR
jgi:hypothetical protein